ncbi:hypothetical protein MJA45_12680 [Paenibacillus aurantius]|uniref:Uncharacterized protein n=1 Tax=Paenibacillus aurantius TaxID=2918900 RepID=A0AA96RHW3_9BACL|nr:hypothetical protein [Paenibacillus aurantius]WNQ13828.1 hypothetical protein MJA45_12680 [Paenibacillus aurantius]
MFVTYFILFVIVAGCILIPLNLRLLKERKTGADASEPEEAGEEAVTRPNQDGAAERGASRPASAEAGRPGPSEETRGSGEPSAAVREPEAGSYPETAEGSEAGAAAGRWPETGPMAEGAHDREAADGRWPHEADADAVRPHPPGGEEAGRRAAALHEPGESARGGVGASETAATAASLELPAEGLPPRKSRLARSRGRRAQAPLAEPRRQAEAPAAAEAATPAPTAAPEPMPELPAAPSSAAPAASQEPPVPPADPAPSDRDYRSALRQELAAAKRRAEESSSAKADDVSDDDYRSILRSMSRPDKK